MTGVLEKKGKKCWFYDYYDSCKTCRFVSRLTYLTERRTFALPKPHAESGFCTTAFHEIKATESILLYGFTRL